MLVHNLLTLEGKSVADEFRLKWMVPDRPKAAGLFPPATMVTEAHRLMRKHDLLWMLGRRMATLADLFHGMTSFDAHYPPPPQRYITPEQQPNAFIADSMFGLTSIQKDDWHEFLGPHSILYEAGWRHHVCKLIPSSSLAQLGVGLCSYWK